ncbi:5-formyltetrahydrofolate cyclo-ligase [Alteripontixanthobacter maritimus]|uniref:5-formyltetrahydrofolate cyclo-ligase n=1 Tax=Alteripontixanthobacter maritimus TaxID=2161824 RepID=A0A369QBU3_9SPHN|nr:5-formyltetrahydrofolate cyclo-ligase [Alteripontixanthobacter maritimus]RDC59718.1 5-formyltetrahydrofolate cyclo-ligase [Alteripontixanthobacter maritimus]
MVVPPPTMGPIPAMPVDWIAPLMTDIPPQTPPAHTPQSIETGIAKAALRSELRAARREHVAALDDATRGLLFMRPPAPLAALVPQGAIVGLYHATAHEAPAHSYARHWQELGHTVALPRLSDTPNEDVAEPVVEFAEWTDMFEESDLEPGPFKMRQPKADAAPAEPTVLFIPLLGFTAAGDRLGQGGGHYDRWLADHPDTVRIGMAWDVQLRDELPTEPHDQRLHAIVTPTRFYEV